MLMLGHWPLLSSESRVKFISLPTDQASQTRVQNKLMLQNYSHLQKVTLYYNSLHNQSFPAITFDGGDNKSSDKHYISAYSDESIAAVVV
jgi:hypothetical protein